MDQVSGRAASGQAGHASHGANELSPPCGDHPSRNFAREDRYFVIKRSDIAPSEIARLNCMPRREAVVVEADWPEYEPVWAMIERRVTGLSPVVGYAGAFYELGEMLGIPAQPISPNRVWKEQMRPAIEQALKWPSEDWRTPICLDPTLPHLDIPDPELIHRVILNLSKKHGVKRRPLWSAVHAMFGLGSTYSKQLCRRFDANPEELVA